jgi:hypothetical protein
MRLKPNVADDGKGSGAVATLTPRIARSAMAAPLSPANMASMA